MGPKAAWQLHCTAVSCLLCGLLIKSIFKAIVLTNKAIIVLDEELVEEEEVEGEEVSHFFRSTTGQHLEESEMQSHLWLTNKHSPLTSPAKGDCDVWEIIKRPIYSDKSKPLEKERKRGEERKKLN